jgi:hypothetical protein
VESFEAWLVLGLDVLPQDLVEVVHGWDLVRGNLGQARSRRAVGTVGGVLVNTSLLPVLTYAPDVIATLSLLRLVSV